MNTPAPEISQTADVATLAADVQKLRDYVESTVRPWRDVLGVNGIKVTISATNVLFDGEELYAGDGFGGNALDNKPTGPTTDIVTGPTTPGGDAGEPFTPGDANTPGASVVYEERGRSGTTTLIGHSEYGTPSTPPRKYRVQTHDQDFKFFSGGLTELTTGIGSVGRSWNQAIGTTSVYDVATGIKTVSGTRHYGGDTTTTRIEYSGALTNSDSGHDADLDMSSAPALGTVAPPFGVDLAADAVFGMVRTSFDADVLAYAASNSVVNGGGGSYALITSGGKSWVLSEPDTESDAIKRLTAGVSWSSWASASIPASTATYTSRGTGFSFDYGNRELRATYAGLPASWTFKVRVRIVRIDLTTGALNTHFTHNLTPTTDGSGAATWTVPIIPDVPGYNYRVQSVTHTF